MNYLQNNLGKVIKKSLQMNLFTKQRDSQTCEINIWLPKGKGVEGE